MPLFTYSVNDGNPEELFFALPELPDFLFPVDSVVGVEDIGALTVADLAPAPPNTFLPDTSGVW